MPQEEARSIIEDMRTSTKFCIGIVSTLIGCGTHLSAAGLRDEQAGLVISLAGYKAHPSESDPDNLRFSSLYCKSREVVMESGNAVADAGVPCK